MKIEFSKNLPIDWDIFLINNTQDGGLLQSSLWVSFQKRLGREVFAVRVYNNQNLLLQTALVKIPFKKTSYSYLFSPRGPILNKHCTKESFTFFFKQLSLFSKEQKCLSYILEPPYDKMSFSLKDFNFKKIKNIEPQDTLIIDLKADVDTLFKKMNSKTRYNIRLAERKGVTVRFINNPKKEDISIFFSLLKKTKNRQKFSIYNQEYFQNLFSALSGSGKIFLVLAELDKQVIASVVIIYWHNFVYYLYGGFDYNYRKVMAPHLMHWEIIKKAKADNKQYYDLWGVQGLKVSGKEAGWGGITRFKRGFAPSTNITHFLGTYEYRYNPYFLNFYNFAKKIYLFWSKFNE